jgi:hypothetical protein
MRVDHFRYGRGSEGNGVNLGPLTIWFSYRTPVAFSLHGETIVRRNDWGTTTGRHLNEIDGGATDKRVSGEEFKEQLRSALLRAALSKLGSYFT